MEHKPQKGKKTLSKKNLGNTASVIIALGAALVIFQGYNLAQEYAIGALYDAELAKAEEAARPAMIELVAIGNDNCRECFDISPVIDSLRRAHVNITKEERFDLASDKARELINRYGIEKIPTIFISGEVDRVSLRGLEKRDDALLFTQQVPPYTDARTSNILGMVSSIVIEDSSCDKCTNLNGILDSLKQSGVKISSEKVIEGSTDEGRELIDKYSLDVLPALILSKDLMVYDSEITRGWNSIGSIEEDGSYVVRAVRPPFLNLTKNRIEGLVAMTTLVSSACEGCYEPEQFHRPILRRFGVVLEEEKRVDVSDPEGKSLIERYGIEKIPTIILKGGMEKYPGLVGAWASVGSVEPDGAYVFRSVEVAGRTYQNLATGEIVEPAQPSEGTGQGA